jgi:hypothetical protein
MHSVTSGLGCVRLQLFCSPPSLQKSIKSATTLFPTFRKYQLIEHGGSRICTRIAELLMGHRVKAAFWHVIREGGPDRQKVSIRL